MTDPKKLKSPGGVSSTRSPLNGLNGEEYLTKVTLSDGISEHSYLEFTSEVPLDWEKYIAPIGKMPLVRSDFFPALDTDHAWSVCYPILVERVWDGSSALSPSQIDQIRERLGPCRWNVLRQEVAEIEEFHRESASYSSAAVFSLTAVWVDLFCDAFSPEWYAAQAMYAHVVRGNDFAFGYLVCELDQKIRNETSFLRGEKIRASAAVGGRTTAASVAGQSAAVLEEMQRLHARGHTISRAAQIAHDNGFGTSSTANRQLWTRRERKLRHR